MLALVERSPPTQIIQHDHISYSSISTYASCPLRFHFRYNLHLPEQTVSSSLLLGAGLHAGVELHFNELLVGNSPPSLDLLLDAFWEAWNARGADVVLTKGEDLNTVGRLAESMFKAFQASSLANPHGTIIGVEEELRGELLPGVPDLLARLDLIVETDDALIITDLKSSRSCWSQEQVSNSSLQLLLYHEIARHLSDKPVKLQFAVLTKTKHPELKLHPVEVGPHELYRSRQIVKRVWQAIEAGIVYPNPSPLNCGTCPFRRPCASWAG